jgi:F-type H+-transporting ATPase subunit delta
MTFDAVAQRYSQAIFELAVETSAVSSLTDEIRLVAEAYAISPEMRVAVQSPLIPQADRLAAIDEVAQRMGLSRITRNVLGVLAERRRLSALPAILSNLTKLADERAGIVRATVASAEPLSETHGRRLELELEQLTGKKVILERRQDPDLLAGIVVRVGDRVIDSSARSRLNSLRSQLLSA